MTGLIDSCVRAPLIHRYTHGQPMLQQPPLSSVAALMFRTLHWQTSTELPSVPCPSFAPLTLIRTAPATTAVRY